MGYFVSFLVTHLINFGLSFRRLLIITKERIPLHVPLLTLAAGMGATWVVSFLSLPSVQALAFPVVLMCLLYLMRIIRGEDVAWLKGLMHKK